MARIFISYKRVDKDRVFKIKDQIESALGEKCWIDLDGIESDAQFANVIIHAIDNCEVVLFMYSRAHSQIEDYENDWTIRELTYAAGEHKRIVFINIDGTPLSKWFKFMYKQKQQIDVSDTNSMKKLISDIRNWLGFENDCEIAEERLLRRHININDDEIILNIIDDYNLVMHKKLDKFVGIIPIKECLEACDVNPNVSTYIESLGMTLAISMALTNPIMGVLTAVGTKLIEKSDIGQQFAKQNQSLRQEKITKFEEEAFDNIIEDLNQRYSIKLKKVSAQNKDVISKTSDFEVFFNISDYNKAQIPLKERLRSLSN